MSEERWTVMRLIDWTKEYLVAADVENPRLEAEVDAVLAARAAGVSPWGSERIA